ncbi:hypothetical protein G6F22_018949 [Rhizopus arrhizus]|nr:hypothetical protein G6F22_018949 [Rhizopus arrhizus]
MATSHGQSANHAGFLRRFRHGADALHRFARVRHVDQRRHQHEAIHADVDGGLDEAQRFAGAGFRHVGQHRDAAGADFHRAPRDLELFFQRQGAGFAQRAAGDQAVDPVVDQEVEMLAHRFEVEGFVGMEFTGDGRKYALPTHVVQLA